MAAAMAMPGQEDAVVKCEADPGGTPGAAVDTAAAEAAADGDAAVVLGAGSGAGGGGGGASGAAHGGPAGGSVLGGGGGGGVDSTPSGVHHSILGCSHFCHPCSPPTPTPHFYIDCHVSQVLFLKDINLPRPDKYDTCALIAFLQQLVTFKGFYDEHLEFLGIERVHIVCTMNPATTVGRHPLSTR